MSEIPPIFVINRAKDTDRRKEIESAYAKVGLTPEFIEAVDGHGDPRELLPFLDLLGEHFWGKPEIKPGAFACFLSHRAAWQAVIDQSLPFAIIAEDDSYPVLDFQSHWTKINTKLKATDLSFLNDRMSDWVEHDFEDVNAAIWRKLAQNLPTQKSRAPGGDAYALTPKAAKILLEASARSKIFCGVDWFMLSTAWEASKAKHKDVKNHFELKQIWREIGSRANLLHAQALKNPMFSIRNGEKSKINHSEIVPIERFRANILG